MASKSNTGSMTPLDGAGLLDLADERAQSLPCKRRNWNAFRQGLLPKGDFGVDDALDGLAFLTSQMNAQSLPASAFSNRNRLRQGFRLRHVLERDFRSSAATRLGSVRQFVENHARTASALPPRTGRASVSAAPLSIISAAFLMPSASVRPSRPRYSDTCVQQDLSASRPAHGPQECRG